MRHSINQLYGFVIQIYKVGTLTKSIYYGMSDSADHLDRATPSNAVSYGNDLFGLGGCGVGQAVGPRRVLLAPARPRLGNSRSCMLNWLVWQHIVLCFVP
jgi:hypothetical protein